MIMGRVATVTCNDCEVNKEYFGIFMNVSSQCTIAMFMSNGTIPKANEYFEYLPFLIYELNA